MSWVNNILSKPVGMGDISTAVGYSSLDLGTLVAKGSIAKWALHKPVRLANGSDTPTDISDYTTWVSKMQTAVVSKDGSVSAPFGLLLGSSDNIYNVIGTNSAPTVDWVYQQPPETGTFWRRMLDFNGYTSSPNVPINPPGEFTYYKAQGAVNVIELDTNDGEAGDTSIPVSVLTQLNSYQLMVAVREGGSGNWYYTVMPGTIMSAVDSATHRISFTLPDSLGITLSSQGYQAYLVGVATGLTTGSWSNPVSDSFMQAFPKSMIPLPFAQKSDCNFLFKVKQDPDQSIVHYNYTIYLTHSYVLKYIEFNVWIYRNVAPPTSFSVQFSNMKIYPDYDYQHTTNFPLTNQIFLFGNGSTAQPFTWDSTAKMSHATLKKDMSSFNYTLDSYPELTYDKTNSSNYGWEGGEFDVKYID